MSLFHTFRSQSKLEEHHKLCKDKNNCEIRLPKEGKNIFSHKFGSKALKMNDAMYLDLECILEKMELLNILIMKTFHLQVKKDMHTVCGYSLTHLSNDTKECNTIASHGKDSLENIGKSLVNYLKKILKTKKTRECPKLNKEQN